MGVAGQGKALLDLRRPSPPTPARPQAGSPHPIQRLGPRQGRAAGGLEHQRAPGRPPGRVEEPALLPQLRAPRPRRPGSRRAARGLRRAARRTDFSASPAPDGRHVTRGRSSTGSAGPGDWREGGVSGSRRRASVASEGAGIASVGENCGRIPGG